MQRKGGELTAIEAEKKQSWKSIEAWKLSQRICSLTTTLSSQRGLPDPQARHPGGILGPPEVSPGTTIRFGRVRAWYRRAALRCEGSLARFCGGLPIPFQTRCRFEISGSVGRWIGWQNLHLHLGWMTSKSTFVTLLVSSSPRAPHLSFWGLNFNKRVVLYFKVAKT